ncbi:chromate transporter [Brevibacillus thermoruber]|uniref:Chromate transporter n=1 Tax=Brevibacillus thermoruber TaxID=33942 RepID=A0A9X3TT17_9BACL|nr:chromate transporter [Brevibacillus thermoruber]MDA5109860.1 chromate transporter [Brevibacillus thermoruber]
MHATSYCITSRRLRFIQSCHFPAFCYRMRKRIRKRSEKSPHEPSSAGSGAGVSQAGSIAFGGPAAHIAMMNEEIVQKRKWVDQETFLDLLGACTQPVIGHTTAQADIFFREAGVL